MLTNSNNKSNNKDSPNGVLIYPATINARNNAKIVYDGLLSENGATEIYAHVGFDTKWKKVKDEMPPLNKQILIGKEAFYGSNTFEWYRGTVSKPYNTGARARRAHMEESAHQRCRQGRRRLSGYT